jgi:c-di-GMP-binding flagellar brake protein YcgR
LFWKKKTSDEYLVSLESDNRRMSFRLDTDDENPVYAHFGKHRVLMRNISAGGVSFDFAEGKEGETAPFSIKLPGRRGLSFSVRAKILHKSGREACHCRLLDLDEDLEEAVHQYVLYAQIHELRKKRSEKDRPICNYGNHSHSE